MEKALALAPHRTLLFDGDLVTPHRVVVVSTVDEETIVEAQVPSLNTRVRIWVNRPTEPDRVIIGLG